MQMTLPMKPPMLGVDAQSIDRRPTFTSALVLCQEIGGMTPRQFFPQDRLCDFMDICSNEAPLIWLARRRGYELVPMETELERQLRVEREKRAELEQENRLMRQLLGR